MGFIPQTANWSPFRAPIPTISYFVGLGFNPRKTEQVLNSSARYAMDYESFTKKVVSSG